jgi:acyl-CoA reductase-like NAD-dependent aldehyde dehydrogenase
VPIPILSPVTGERIAVRRETSAADLAEHVRAFERSATPGERARRGRRRLERCERLDAAAAWLDVNLERVASDLVLEHGKPLAQAREETAATVTQIRLTASFARAFGPVVPPIADPAKRILIDVGPLGIVAAITPWNFPLFVPVEYLAPALAMGNSVLWKPAESTPLSNANLLSAFRAGGFGDDELAMLHGGPATGRRLVAVDAIRALGFTGSTEVGTEIARRFGGRPLLTELGGNGPTIVFADADIAVAARAIATASFGTSGQSCAATERVLVQEAVAEPLAAALAEVAAAHRLGDPRDPATTLGPLHLTETVEKVRRHIDDAVARGASLRCGGCALVGAPTGNYWPATVVTDVPREAALFREETFGPVAPLTPFTDEKDALALALEGAWGLSAAIFTADLDRAHRVADELPHGLVAINEHSDYWEPPLPIGGGPGTRSGSGRLGIDNALRFFSTTKVLAVHVG